MLPKLKTKVLFYSKVNLTCPPFQNCEIKKIYKNIFLNFRTKLTLGRKATTINKILKYVSFLYLNLHLLTLIIKIAA